VYRGKEIRIHDEILVFASATMAAGAVRKRGRDVIAAARIK
jgi:hypothetical protein